MAIVKIVGGSAGGPVADPPDPSQLQSQFIPSTDLFFIVDGERFSPIITQTLELENSGDESKITDQCGRTTRNKSSNSGWLLRVEGIVSKPDRPGNLSLSRLKEVAKMDNVEVHCALHDGTLVVGNVVVRQENDIHSVETQDTAGKEEAFPFTMQLGEEDSES